MNLTALGSLPELLPGEVMHSVALSMGRNTAEQGPAWEPYCPGAAQDSGPSSGAVVLGSPRRAACMFSGVET